MIALHWLKPRQTMRTRINDQHMRNGVTMIDPHHTYIDADVTIGQDSVILPGTMLKGKPNWRKLHHRAKQ